MIVIGDVHGKTKRYSEIVGNLKEPTIQVGDFGFEHAHRWHMAHVDPDQHKVLFGNHDFYPLLNAPHSLGDYAILDGGIMTIRGAFSIDRANRTDGVDWFKEEELTMEKCYEAVDLFAKQKPSVVITHDCPTEVCNHMHGQSTKTRTDQLLQACFIQHQPELWIFGHHHRSFKMNMGGTLFLCLDELETFQL